MSTNFPNRVEFVWPILHRTFNRTWAENFLHKGELWFTKLNKFPEDNNCERGDLLEGTGKFIQNGQMCTRHSYSTIFVCCFTMETSTGAILNTWKDRDTVAQIYNTQSFTNRIRDAAIAGFEKKFFKFMVGPVTYDKDEGSHRVPTFGIGAFQKNKCFNHQKEFRFALLLDCCLRNEPNITLKLDDCTDIARIL